MLPAGICWRVKGDGAIHWSTPQATRLINAATGSDDGLDLVAKHIATFMRERERPGPARDNLLSISNGGQAALQLAFLGAIGADEYLFRLTATNQRADDGVLRQHFALTQRRSEVLLWIAKGKSNRDIGEILEALRTDGEQTSRADLCEARRRKPGLCRGKGGACAA